MNLFGIPVPIIPCVALIVLCPGCGGGGGGVLGVSDMMQRRNGREVERCMGTVPRL